MVTCLNCPPNKRKTYTGREPSPNGKGYSATYEIDGKVMKGTDGQDWQVTPIGTRKVWKAIPGRIWQDIPLEDNGGTPFAVRLSKLDTAYVYQIFDHVYEFDKGLRPLKTPDEPYDVVSLADLGTLVLWRPLVVRHKAFFIPEDRSSVLFRVGPRQYIFASMEVSSFTTEDDIQEFHSCLGNSAVPYGFAVGERNTYFLAYYEKMNNKEILKHRADRSRSVDVKKNRLGFQDYNGACDMGSLNAWDPYEIYSDKALCKRPSKIPYKVIMSRP